MFQDVHIFTHIWIYTIYIIYIYIYLLYKIHFNRPGSKMPRNLNLTMWCSMFLSAMVKFSQELIMNKAKADLTRQWSCRTLSVGHSAQTVFTSSGNAFSAGLFKLKFNVFSLRVSLFPLKVSRYLQHQMGWMSCFSMPIGSQKYGDVFKRVSVIFSL